MTKFFYNILFTPNETFASSFKVISDAGYTLIHPDEHIITGVIDSEPFESDNQKRALDIISEKGGILKLWGKSINPALWLNHSDLQLSELSVIIDKSYFTDANCELISEHMKNLFTELCKKTGAVYGYADDEHSCRIFGYDSNIENIISGKEPVLSWLNYFSSSYLEKIGGRKVFQNFNCKISEIPTYGIMVSFFNHPWEADLAEIQLLNEKWKEEQIFKDILK
jgi:hypothetical protein